MRIGNTASYLLLIAFSVAVFGYLSLYFVKQQIQEQQIELIDWQVPELDSHNIKLKNLKFLYQKNYLVTLSNLSLFSKTGLTQALEQPSIDKLSIQKLTIRLLKPINTERSDTKKPNIEEILQLLQQPLFSLVDKPTLALFPKQLEIQQFILQAPCPAGSCELESNLQLNSDLKDEQLEINFSLQSRDTALHSIQITNQLHATVDFQSQSLDFSNSSHLINTQQDDISLLLTINSKEVTSTNKPVFQLASQLHGKLPLTEKNENSAQTMTASWNNLLQLYNRWSPQPLSKEELMTAITPYLQSKQIDTKDDFELNLEGKLGFSKPTQPVYNLWQQLNLNTHSTLTLHRPISIADSAQLSGRVQSEISLQQGTITHYSINAEGIASQLKKPLWLINQGWQFNSVNFSVQSEQQDKNILFERIPFQLGLKNTEPNEQFDLQSTGNLILDESPSVIIDNADLTLSKNNLTLTPELQLSNLQSTIKIKGKIQQEASLLEIQQANLSTQIRNKQTSIKLNKTQLSKTQISFAELSNPLDKLQINGKQLELNLNYKSPELAVKELDLVINQIHLEPIATGLKQFKINYKAQLQELQHSQLHPQPWSAQGKISAQLTNTLNELKSAQIKGQETNQSGLKIYNRIDYRPSNLNLNWQIADNYFLAGNPFQETFSDWPELLSFSSGKIAAKGQLQLALNKTPANSDWQQIINKSLRATSDIKLSGIDGIYNETAFKKLNLDSHLQLRKGVLQSKSTEIHLEELNHGLVMGPIVVKANTQTPINNWQATTINLQKTEVGVFEGTANIPAQQIKLDKPVVVELLLNNINLQSLLTQYPSAEIYGTGLLQGRLPITLDLNNRLKNKPILFIANGKLFAAEPGGILQYQADTSGLKQTHKSMELVFNLLEDFHYKVLDSRISLDENQKLTLKLRLQGNNPSVEEGRQVNFNIQIEEDLPALITSMQISNQLSNTIQKRIQEKLQRKINRN